MTREEAKNFLINISYKLGNMAIEYLTEKDGEKMREAIKALEQEPCDDEYIKVPKKALKYRTAGMVAYNAEWLRNHFDIERAVICGAQEPCDDVVSRRAAIEIARSNIHYGLDKEYEYSRQLLEKTMAEISSLPPITPQPKTGHWIKEKERHFLDTRTNVNVEMKEAMGKGYHTYINVQCSKCRKITIHDDSILYQYCPHCGAKMNEPQESEGV